MDKSSVEQCCNEMLEQTQLFFDDIKSDRYIKDNSGVERRDYFPYQL